MKYLYSLLFLLMLTSKSFCACIQSPWATLKDGPGHRYQNKWVLPKNTPLKVIKMAKNWVLVEEVDNVRSWIKRSDITKDYFCGIVKKEKTTLKQLRTKKGPPRKIWATYDESYRILKFTKNNWALVKNEQGTIGFVNKQALWVH